MFGEINRSEDDILEAEKTIDDEPIQLDTNDEHDQQESEPTIQSYLNRSISPLPEPLVSLIIINSNYIVNLLQTRQVVPCTVTDKDVEAETKDIKEVLAILQRMESKFDKRMDAIECDIAVIKKAITKKKSKKV